MCENGSSGPRGTRETSRDFTSAPLFFFFFLTKAHHIPSRTNPLVFVVNIFSKKLVKWDLNTGKKEAFSFVIRPHLFHAIGNPAAATFFLANFWTSQNLWLRLVKLPIKLRLIRGASVSLPIDVLVLPWSPGMKEHLCHLPQAWTCPAIFSLHKHVTLSSLQPRSLAATYLMNISLALMGLVY